MSSSRGTLALAVLASTLSAACCRSRAPCPTLPPPVLVERPAPPCLTTPPDLSIPRRWVRLGEGEGCPRGLACWSDLDAAIMADVLERAVLRVREDWALCGPRQASQPTADGDPSPLAVPGAP